MFGGFQLPTLSGLVTIRVANDCCSLNWGENRSYEQNTDILICVCQGVTSMQVALGLTSTLGRSCCNFVRNLLLSQFK